MMHASLRRSTSLPSRALSLSLLLSASYGVLLGCGGTSAPSAASDPDAGATPVADAGAQGSDGGAVPKLDGGAVDRCQAVKNSVLEAGFGDKVTVTCDGTYAYVKADTYPDHVKMDGITGTNDQVPVPAPGYASPVTLSPQKAAQPTSIDAALAIAVNGVPIYDYSSQGSLDLAAYDPKFDTVLTGELDQCNGHSGRGDDYHYHAAPTCMMQAMRNKGPGAILGWAFDGYPIYGNTNPDGSAISTGELDVCNAKADAVFGYRYHTSARPPYIIQCLTGTFDMAKAPRVSPLQKLGGGGGRPPGQKAPGGVQNLKLVEAADGTRTMSYTHQGTNYSIAYKPSSTANCWDFTDKSYTTGGVVKTGTYCRPTP
jgi:YHYH protein